MGQKQLALLLLYIRPADEPKYSEQTQFADAVEAAHDQKRVRTGGKDGLYRACLAGFAEARLQALGRFFDVPKTQDEMELRVELLVGELLDVHIQEPEIVAILFTPRPESEHAPSLHHSMQTIDDPMRATWKSGAGQDALHTDPVHCGSLARGST